MLVVIRIITIGSRINSTPMIGCMMMSNLILGISIQSFYPGALANRSIKIAMVVMTILIDHVAHAVLIIVQSRDQAEIQLLVFLKVVLLSVLIIVCAIELIEPLGHLRVAHFLHNQYPERND